MGGGSAPQQLLTKETQLLEMLGNGAPMMKVLKELCNVIDAQSPGAVTTVFLLDSSGTRLTPVAGPKAPKSWREEIDKVNEGPYAGFCSTAAYQGRLVTAGDFSRTPLFAVYHDAALREGLRIACLKPILSIEKQILGALALSYPRQERRRVTDSDMLERAIHLAAEMKAKGGRP